MLNVDQGLAGMVADGLRLRTRPKPAEAARPPRTDLKASPSLSIIRNGPGTFRGRKVGALATDGVSAELVKALKKALDQEGALLEFVAPAIGGAQASDSSWIEAGQKIDGGPSVLYDAVALLLSEAGAGQLVSDPAARDFIADTYAHAKFIAFSEAALLY